MMKHWKQNLAVVWASQFLSIMGFSFALPFAPFYIQELGIEDDQALKMWTALFAAATPLSLAICAPIWGMIADRYGRKPMLLRAYFGATVVLAMMGMIHNVKLLIFLRFCQGIFTGTITASQALIASGTPEHRNGFALGSLSSAVYSGGMVGALFGGWVADHYGYRAAFQVSAGFLFLCAAMVLFGVHENFSRPAAQETNELLPELPRTAPWKIMAATTAPILLLFFALAFTRQFDSAFFPLRVQELHGSLDGVASITGKIIGGCGIAGVLAGFISGWLSDRFSASRLTMWFCALAAVFLFPQGLAGSLLGLFGFRFMMVLFAGALDPVLQTWLAKVTPSESRGIVFGWSTTAKSLGWMISPLLAGTVACTWGIPMVFFVGAVLFVLMVPLVRYLEIRFGRRHYGKIVS